MPDTWLTQKEAADQLGCTPESVKKYREREGLPFVKLAHNFIRISQEDLDRWMESRKRVQDRT